MGSRIMHAIIGNRIAEILEIEDRTSFMAGSVAADAVFSVDEKNASHFFVGDAEDYTRRVDFEGFLEKYSSEFKRKNPYLLGYYAHLAADDIWLKGFYLSWLRNRMNADKEMYKIYHNDFRLLNGKLIEHYGVANELKQAFSQLPAIIDLEEVKAKEVQELIPYVLGDMEYEKSVLDEELKVFTLVQIVGYLETSIGLGVLKLREILK
ncbi:zinc dependent phospholipase C family protein [Falsibacillus pallidus]|uniref:Zinc dependent phospholipase C n=1 Tax=Falsibacillus pallidus TaxID=493781 RepID=A0A370GED8_9BACI|nr:zinc dependent phospholipase C family protein [Falsibacillus pallidus]RDI42168.1 zinc dependent phospholipase C [Falsibacillus pallidus]